MQIVRHSIILIGGIIFAYVKWNRCDGCNSRSWNVVSSAIWLKSIRYGRSVRRGIDRIGRRKGRRLPTVRPNRGRSTSISTIPNGRKCGTWWVIFRCPFTFSLPLFTFLPLFASVYLSLPLSTSFCLCLPLYLYLPPYTSLSTSIYSNLFFHRSISL